MKKILLLAFTALMCAGANAQGIKLLKNGKLVQQFDACDFDQVVFVKSVNLESEQLAEATTFVSNETSNLVSYAVEKDATISIYWKKADGSEEYITSGQSGSFLLTPKRGASNNQTLVIYTTNPNHETVRAEKTVNVYVKPDLDRNEKLLLGSAGKKIWKWAEDGYECWGNAGNSGNGAGFTANNVDGKWWGVTESADLVGQMQHAAGDEARAQLDAQTGSYMIFDEDGTIKSYTADGQMIRSSSYSINNWDESRSSGWALGTLSTESPAILWPYSINEGGLQVNDFDIMYLDGNNMTLVYTKGYAAGSWGEITYWRFVNASINNETVEGIDNNEVKWYWANDGYECWGNAGNTGNGSGYTAKSVDGKWWGVLNGSELSDQLSHAGGVDYGDADDNAYMIFKDGKLTSYRSDGSIIRSGEYTLNTYEYGRNGNWELGKLTTSTPALLFPWSINEGGKAVNDFDIMYMDGSHMTLVNTKGTAYGGWSEITYWRFSTKH